MRKIAIAGGILLLSTFLAGCTTTLATGSPTQGIAKGYSYQLPSIAYDVEIKRVLSRCPERAGEDIKFDATVTATSRLTPGDTIVVDYLAAGSGLKTTDFAMTNHPTGMLKTINVTIADQSSAVIKEAVKAGVGVAKLAIGLPSGAGVAGGAGAARVTYLKCTDAIAKKLASLPSLKAAVKTAEDAAKKAQQAQTGLETASKAGKPAKASDLAALAKATREANATVEAKKKDQDDTLASLTLIQRQAVEIPPVADQQPRLLYELLLSDATASTPQPITFFELFRPMDAKRSLTIPLALAPQPAPAAGTPGACGACGGFMIQPDDIRKATATGYPSGQAGVDALKADRESLIKEISDDRDNGLASPYASFLSPLDRASVIVVAGRLSQVSPAIALSKASTCDSKKADCGVVYRTLAPGRFRACSRTTPASCFDRPSSGAGVLFQEDRSIPQFGQLMSLSLINGPFANNVLAAEFTAEGNIVSFSYKKPVAEAQAALAGVNDVVGGVSEAIQYQRGRELARLKEQKALYEAQLGSDQAKAALSPTELKLLTDQKALVDAQIALATSQANAQPSQIKDVDNQTLLIDAQLRRVQKEILLKKAQQELEALAPPATQE